ncbi:MAG: hypothetical protein QXW00_03945 [Candidatus Woesearchaeota archaeon]
MRALRSRGFAKTVEMLIAVSIIFTFSLIIIPQSARFSEQDLDLSFLDGLALDENFRRAVLYENVSAVNIYVRDAMDSAGLQRLNFTLSISKDPSSTISLPSRDVKAYSMFVSAEKELLGPKILRVYVWKD